MCCVRIFLYFTYTTLGTSLPFSATATYLYSEGEKFNIILQLQKGNNCQLFNMIKYVEIAITNIVRVPFGIFKQMSVISNTMIYYKYIIYSALEKQMKEKLTFDMIRETFQNF